MLLADNFIQGSRPHAGSQRLSGQGWLFRRKQGFTHLQRTS
jgi:hypothetical protein